MGKVTYELGDGSTTTRFSSDPSDEIPVPEGALIVEDEGSGEISEFSNVFAQMGMSLVLGETIAQLRANGEIRAVEVPDVEVPDVEERPVTGRGRGRRKGADARVEENDSNDD